MLTDRTRLLASRRRKGVAGILAALILFAMIFTVGLTYFTVIQSNNSTAEASAATNQARAQALSQEKLSLAPSLSGQTLTLSVLNSGGVSSTITAAFVTTPSGVIWTDPTTQLSYFTEPPDLEIGGSSSLSLPLTLGVGENTSLMSCPSPSGNCNLVFSSYDYSGHGQTVLLSVLTQDGNIFSSPYPPNLTTETAVSGVVSVQSTQEVLTNVVTNAVTNYVTGDTTTVGCYACVNEGLSGGDALVMTIIATPSPVQSGGTISALVTVYDYSSYAATHVSVYLTDQTAGNGSVTATGGCSTALSIPAEVGTSPGDQTCTATFTAQASSSAGSVVFYGYAIGCVQTGSGSVCTSGTGGGQGTTITSATTSSNPVQIGNLISVGPWSPNFNYFKYTAANQHTAVDASIIPDTATYVAVSVEVTNTYDESLTLIDYSYAQFISPGSDVDAYLVSSVAYSGTSGTITASTCSDVPPNAPTGSNCITVAPGGTVVLTFAASSYGGSTWEWGNTDQGGTNIGTTVQIVLAYALASGSSYSIYAENLPFQTVFVQ